MAKITADIKTGVKVRLTDAQAPVVVVPHDPTDKALKGVNLEKLKQVLLDKNIIANKSEVE